MYFFGRGENGQESQEGKKGKKVEVGCKENREESSEAKGRRDWAACEVNLPEYRATFYFYSGKTSDIARQLAFAGIALIWLFKKEENGQFTVPADLHLPGALIVGVLALDLIQYILGAFVWFLFYRIKERAGFSDKKKIDHSNWLEAPIWIPFFLKTITILYAYWLMLFYLLNAISFK